MAIKVKAIERNVSFDKNKEKWAYVLQADLYSKLSQSKVINEASLRSGITRGSINAAWDAIGEVIKAWATEGHAVAIPGLGSMRFGLRATSVADVNKVATSLITTRRVIFVPTTEIKDELARTSINITCYDRNGQLVKRVTSNDDGTVEDNDNENDNENENGGTGGSNENQNSGTNPEPGTVNPEPGTNPGGGGGDDGDGTDES
jgi:predicted histone-like DNA-binding protein